MIRPTARLTIQRTAYFVALALVLSTFISVRQSAAQEPASKPAQQSPKSKQSSKANPSQPQAAPEQKGFGAELAEQTREATGADEQEEHADLKHSSTVQWLGRKLGLNVHQAHMLALFLNFAVIVILVVWAARKFLPAIFRNRTASIKQAIEEARAASQDANRRLADIENRLGQLSVEIGQMQATAEKEAAAEEARIRTAAEEDIRKVVVAAEQEIATAAKQARRDLSAHTAGLAIALAQKQIHVDPTADQTLVRTFAGKLGSDNDGGKVGR